MRPNPDRESSEPASSNCDEALMVRVRDGEVAAFEELVERHKNVVFSLALAMLRSREDAEEAAQDTFIKMFRARAVYDPARPLEPWLLRIAGNTCRDRLRRRRVHNANIKTGCDPQELSLQVPDPRSLGKASREANHQAVRHAVEQLSEKLRLPLTLKFLHGLTNRQIGASLDISLSNVKLRLARAKDFLQARLERVFEG